MIRTCSNPQIWLLGALGFIQWSGHLVNVLQMRDTPVDEHLRILDLHSFQDQSIFW